MAEGIGRFLDQGLGASYIRAVHLLDIKSRNSSQVEANQLYLTKHLQTVFINTTTAWILKTLRSLTEREIITNDYFWKHSIPKETPLQGMTTY